MNYKFINYSKALIFAIGLSIYNIVNSDVKAEDKETELSNVKKIEEIHPLDTLGTARKYDIKIGGPGFVCNEKLNQVEQMICNSWELSYVDRHLNFSYKSMLFGAKKGHPATNIYKTKQKDWLKKRDRCSSVECIGQSYIDRLCELDKYSWDKTAREITPESRAASARYSMGYSDRDQWLVFRQRVKYVCDKQDKSWDSFLRLIWPYTASAEIEDITFKVSEFDIESDRQLCNEFVSLLNSHKNKEELACNLPDISSNPNFTLPDMRPITKQEFDRYKKNISTFYFPQSESTVEIGWWPAFYSRGFNASEINNKNIAVIKWPVLSPCLWGETGNPSETFLWDYTNNKFSSSSISKEELIRIGSEDEYQLYENVDIEGVSTKNFMKISGEMIFLYKGETYLSTKYNRNIMPFKPGTRSLSCSIESEVKIKH